MRLCINDVAATLMRHCLSVMYPLGHELSFIKSVCENFCNSLKPGGMLSVEPLLLDQMGLLKRLWAYADGERLDQPAHPCSLISVFTVR